MKKLFLMLGFVLIFSCNQKAVNVNDLKSPDEKAIYALLVERCNAINKKDIQRFKNIYVKDAPELKWIEKTGIPMWNEKDTSFSVGRISRMAIIKDNAAVKLTLDGNSGGYAFTRYADILFVKFDNEWKILCANDS